MIFPIFVNAIPCAMVLIFAWMLKAGKVPFGVGLMQIKRRDLPVQYVMFMSGYAFLTLVLLSFAAYLDWASFFPQR